MEKGEVPISLWSRPAQPKGPAGEQKIVQGVTPDTWFGPLQPLNDFAPQDVAGRQWDYPTGYNLQVTPRPLDKITFTQLRVLADKCDIISVIISNRKDQIESREWIIRPKGESKADSRKRAKEGNDPRIDQIMQFLAYPDKVNSWDQWLRMLLDDLFIIDAPAVYIRRDRAGGIYGLEVLDGGTIALNVDANGRRPLPPSPAFKQILKGVPAISYTTDQLIYMPRNARTWGIFGRSPVEQTMITINAAINRATFNANYYSEGNIPDAIGSLPDTFTPKQVADFTLWWDSQYTGNLSERRKVKFVPGKGTLERIKEPELKNVYDDYIARILCFAMGISAQPFVSMMNRATAETAKGAADEDGKAPIENWVKNLVNKVIQSPQFFNYPDLEFDWSEREDTDPKVQSEILDTYVRNGTLSYDEVRERLGEEARGGISAEPGVVTANGFITLDQAAAQTDANIENAKNPPVKGGGVGGASESTGAKSPNDSSSGTGSAPAPKEETAKASGSKKKPKKIHISLKRKAVTAARKALVKPIHDVLHQAGQSVERQLRDKLGKSDDDSTSGMDLGIDLSILAGLDDATRSVLESLADDTGTLTLGKIGFSTKDSDIFDKVHTRAAQWAQERAAELVAQVEESTRNKIRDAIAKGLAENAGRDAIIEDLMDSTAFSEERATLIADTESAIANGQGNLMGMEEAQAAGVNIQKEWDATDEPCQICQDNQDDGAIDLDQSFSSGDDTTPAHPNCRCVIVGVTSD